MDPITGRFTGQSKVYALSGFIRGMVRDKVGVAFIGGWVSSIIFLGLILPFNYLNLFHFFLMNFECSDEKLKSCYFIAGRK